MPNWCTGNIRLRGKGKEIAEFLKNELVTTGYEKELAGATSEKPTKIDDDGYELVIAHDEKTKDWLFRSFYIKGTHRNFIDGNTITAYMDEEDRAEGCTVCIDDIKAAWGFEPGPYVAKAQKYGIDIKIIGFERGMEMKQIIEVVDGKIARFDEIEFEDWDWECEMPNMGG